MTGVVQIFVAAMRAMHAQAFPLAATHLTATATTTTCNSSNNSHSNIVAT